MKNGALQKLFDLIDTLRGENGCPWDRVQTPAGILSDLVEEVYELQWAYARRGREDVFEETGDVLFVFTFALKLLQEEYPELTLERLTSAAYDKIVHRHPHVFGGDVANTKEEGLAHWNRVKAQEKAHRADSIFTDVPGRLPPVRRAEKIQRRAARVGFDWSDTRGIFDKIREEVDELERTLSHGGDTSLAEGELGDLFFSVINLSRFLNIDAEKALTATNAKFVRRFLVMERMITADDRQLEGMTLEEMDRYWELAKREE
jgi:tetrapyrrole methylase family protein/MazG family protein